jgi:hypothetical protein
MRRNYLWLGLLAVGLFAVALQPWRAFAALGPTAPTAGVPAALQGVPLKQNWWASVPNINPQTKINYSLEARLAQDSEGEQAFMVYLKAQADTSNSISDWNAKGEYVLGQLERVKNATQPSLMAAVNQERAESNISRVTQFTIINAVHVRGNAEAARDLAARDDVAFIEPESRYELDDSVNSPELQAAIARAQAETPNVVEPGVNYVKAPQAWAMGYRGEGIVVANIDSGVQYDHPALVRQYRGNLGGGNFDHNYNWWDARQDAPRQNVPYDDDGHGTHTMGTVVGEDASMTNQIGVAPGARWIAAKVFPGGGSSGNEEITVAEDFMLAPWDLNMQNRRPDLRPHVINNSWGDGECWNTDSWMITQVWIDAGIWAAFSNGNSGPSGGTVGSPGSYPFIIGTGAISVSTGNIAGFSSRGPSCFNGQIKPDVVAPGVSVRSSLPGNTYGPNNGTSMAAPHNAGVMALIRDANPSLTYTEMTSILTRTTFFNPSWGTRPNNNYGWGAVQADTAVDMALHGAHVHGTVTSSAGGAPIPGAHVSALRTSDNDYYQVQAFGNGTYSMTVRAGTYNMSAWAFGYMTQTLTGVNVMSDTSPLQNFSLTPMATHQVSGNFFMAGTCAPMSGTLRIEPPEHLTVTVGMSGQYSVALPAGTYTFTAQAGAYYQPIVEVVTVSGPTSRNYTFGARHDMANTYHVVNPGTVAPISGTTQLTFDDAQDGYSAVTLPFPFTFYGQSYTSMNVSTNGYVTFNVFQQARMWVNTWIPQPGPTADSGNYLYPNNAIYPYWDDLSIAPRSYGSVHTAVIGTAPNRTFVVEWRGVAGAGDPITFELMLEETSNNITVLYSDVAGPYGFGYSSTQGIENATGNDGIQVGFNHMGMIGNGMALRYVPAAAPSVTPCVPAVTPTVPAATATSPAATVTPGNATPTACTVTFTDVQPTDTFYPFIRCLACRGIISGYADGTFRPNNNITRGQIAKMVANSAGFQEPISGQTFEDVPPASPFYVFIERLFRRGHMGGYPCGQRTTETCIPPENRPYFRPNEDATRGQLSKIVSNAAGYTEPHTGQFYTDVTGDNPFYLEIMRLTTRGAMSGYPCGGPGEPCDPQNRPYFRWANPVTRGQASKIVANTFFPNCQTPR